MLLALALAASPAFALPSVHVGTGPASVADAVPCHDDAPAAVAPSPCEDGCCPQPDCDPAHCRIAAPLVMAMVWPGPLASPNGHARPWQAAMRDAAPIREQLRPPIA